MTSKEERRLNFEHGKFEKIEKDNECYTPPYGDERINYIERSYVTDYSPLTEYLRVYKRKSGKRVGTYYTKYDKNHNALKQYLEDVNKNKLPNTIAQLRKIDVDELQHMREHITLKVTQKHRKMIRELLKEKKKIET